MSIIDDPLLAAAEKKTETEKVDINDVFAMLESILESSINSKITEIDVSLRGYLSSLQGELESDGENMSASINGFYTRMQNRSEILFKGVQSDFLSFRQPINEKIDKVKQCAEENLKDKFSQQLMSLNNRLHELDAKSEQLEEENHELNDTVDKLNKLLEQNDLMNRDPNDRSLQKIIPLLKQAIDEKQRDYVKISHQIDETMKENLMETVFVANKKKTRRIKYNEQKRKIENDKLLLSQLLTAIRGQVGRINSMEATHKREMEEQVLILKDGIYERDNRINQLKRENQQLQNQLYMMNSALKRDDYKTELHSVDSIGNNNNNNNNNNNSIINESKLEEHTERGEEESKTEFINHNNSNNNEKTITPSQSRKNTLTKAINQSNDKIISPSRGPRRLSSTIAPTRPEPATIETMNQEVYSINVGQWGGTNYRWKSMGLYRKECSDVQLETSRKRPSERMQKELKGRKSITRTTAQSMLTTNWIPSLSLYTSPKHFTSTLRPKTSQLALELLTQKPSSPLKEAALEINSLKTYSRKTEGELVKRAIKSPDNTITPLIPVSKQ